MDAEKSVSGKLGHTYSEVKGGADSAVHIGHIGHELWGKSVLPFGPFNIRD